MRNAFLVIKQVLPLHQGFWNNEFVYPTGVSWPQSHDLQGAIFILDGIEGMRLPL